MPERGKLLWGTLVLTSGRVAGYGLSFLRNLILARVLAKADYGLAAVFSMAMMLLELAGRMAFGMQIIQSPEGESPRFQASAHALQFIAGVCSSTMVVCTSVPLARLFGVPQAWWAFALLAIVPFCQGVAHLDVSRRQRELDYVPLVMVDVVPQLLTAVAAWPLARWLGDYRVIVWLMVGKAVLGSGMTFVFSRSPYRWAWERAHIISILSFGWPLLLTGLVMFGSQQLDQVLVGAVFSLNVLAGYALAFSLVSIPWFIFGQVLSSLMLPVMARTQNDPVLFRRQYRMCAQVAAVGGVICILPLIVSGEQLVILLYGPKYVNTGPFMAILGAAAAARFLRFAPAVAAVARADTINQLYSNVWRAASLPLALGVWATGGTPAQIALCALAGEILAITVSLVRLQRRQGVPLGDSCGASLYVVTLVSAGLAFALLGGASLSASLAAIFSLAACCVAAGAAWLMFPDVARFLTHAIQRRPGKGADNLRSMPELPVRLT